MKFIISISRPRKVLPPSSRYAWSMLLLKTAESWTDPCHLHTKLVKESSALRTAMALMAWKPLWQTYMCSSPLLLSPLAYVQFWRNQPLFPIKQEQILYELSFKQYPPCLFPSKFKVDQLKSEWNQREPTIPYAFRMLLQTTPLCPKNSKKSPMHCAVRKILCTFSGFTHFIGNLRNLCTGKLCDQSVAQKSA